MAQQDAQLQAKRSFFQACLDLVPKSISLTGNAQLDGLIFKGIVLLAGLIGERLYDFLDYKNPHYLQLLTGLVVCVLVGLVSVIYGWINSRILQARHVYAGAQLAASKQAILVDAGNGNAVVAPVSAAAAQVIVKEFAKPQVIKADTSQTVAMPDSGTKA